MPEYNLPAEPLAQQYVRLNPVLLDTMRSTLQQMVEHIETQVRPAQVAVVLTQLSPSLQKIAQDIRQMLLASNRLYAPTVELNAQIRDLQHETSRTLAQLARNLAPTAEATYAAINHAGPTGLDSFARILEVATDDGEVLAASARAAEEALKSDPKTRKQIARSATRISQWTSISTQEARTLLLALMFLFMVVGPWSDGVPKLDDLANPAAASAAVMVAAIDANSGERKNLLQKNGPRRRRPRKR